LNPRPKSGRPGKYTSDYDVKKALIYERHKEKCPICGAESELQFLLYEIPHFGDALMFIAVCPSCGYRYTDVMILSGEKKGRYEIEISSADDLNVTGVGCECGTEKRRKFYFYGGRCIEARGKSGEDAEQGCQGEKEEACRICFETNRANKVG